MNRIPLRNVAVVCALALSGAPLAAAQQGSDVPPGLYAHTIKHETYLQRGSSTVDISEGNAGFADNDQLEELDTIPSFLANESALAPGMADNLRGCGVYEGSTPPLSDQPLQSDFERFDREILDEIDEFLNQGYPPASVIMHAASLGIPLDRAVFAAIRSQPARASELYRAALELMAFLPGWTCTTGADQGRFNTVYNVNDLPDERLVSDVAQRYFGERSRLARFPDWPNNEFHMLASTTELLDLIRQYDTQYWYRPGPRQQAPGAHPRETVLIGLYPDTEQIVIDTSAERIRQWRDAGRERVPVTFFFNHDYQRPISRFAVDAGLEEVMDAFFARGEELTPVPLFTVGDFHMEVEAGEINELFEDQLPESDEIDPGRYEELADGLAANGFSKEPVMISLLRRGGYTRLSKPDRVRVALDQGYERLPVTLFYHRLDREPCASPAVCFERVCDALVCAGGDRNACLDPAAAGAVRESSFDAPTGGGGGDSPPPPPPPASPS